MTTHKNTPEQQYHHAPLNGLIIGAVWALAIFGYQVSSILAGADSKLSSPRLFMSLIFPLVGWLTGLWERRVYACDDPKKRRCRAKIIGSAMAILTGVFMFFLSDPLDMIATLSGK